ncbi:PLD nuclease N-terminal domain-containing protein [Tsukamurella sp. M9C]|uniref:PLD nuclease N-terminal domain-containing protein n=1 Tax=unclassified Tsukamurella TaxID=2633480 RepID=UPI001CD03400|nr:PLD nuclease N-terminal domain-containing protein [Tsukamurella sp. M9C]MCA0157128.1 PLD nuclease N-terminal domain-containing protein [Tsukamurella sp. M9C]
MPYFGAIVMLMWVAALIDVIVSDEYRVRHLPKGGWLIVVILIPLAGSLIWFLLGRPVGAPAGGGAPSRATGFPEYERPGRHIAQYADDDDEFLRQCRERAEQQRRRAKEMDARNHSESPEDKD